MEGELDLTPYIHTSAPAIPETFSLERAYLLFRSLGARHLTIVDQHNRVKGIVTRKARPAALKPQTLNPYWADLANDPHMPVLRRSDLDCVEWPPRRQPCHRPAQSCMDPAPLAPRTRLLSLSWLCPYQHQVFRCDLLGICAAAAGVKIMRLVQGFRILHPTQDLLASRLMRS